MRALVSTLALLIALAAAPATAQYVAPGAILPVVANLGGVNDSSWRTDVTVLNLTDHAVSIQMILIPELVNGEPTFEQVISGPITIPAGGQLTMPNILLYRFGLNGVKGGLSIYTTDGSPVLVSSRTYNVPEGGGTYGQDVSGLLVADTAWLAGLEHDGLYRTNLGILVPASPGAGETLRFTVTVYDAQGTQRGSGTLDFDRAGLQQVPLSAFGVGTLVDGYAVISCSDPTALWYGYASRADQITSDAVFRVARSMPLTVK